MNDKKNPMDCTYEIRPIGIIRRGEQGITLEVAEPYRKGLKELAGFSHVMAFWWATEFDVPEYRSLMTSEPPYAPGMEVGVFATRSPYRPNPVMMTTCKLLDVDDARGLVHVADLDTFDGTPLIDLKAYFAVCDRVQDPHLPDWLQGWPEWMPEEGIGLMEHEK